MTTAGQVQPYNTAYRSVELPARRRVRAETYGEDMGQNSWLTKDEWRIAFGCLGLTAASRILDVALARVGPTSISLARSASSTSIPDNPALDAELAARRLITRAVTRRACGALVHHEDEVQRPLPASESPLAPRPSRALRVRRSR